MDLGGAIGSLELRRAGDGTRRLEGTFPYNSRAIIDAGGNGRRPRKEQFAPRAFSYAIEEGREVHFLVGHSFDKPLASRGAGTLALTDGDDALTFSATLSPEIQRASYVQDFLAGFGAGLVMGISPGFRVAPPEAVPDSEEVVEEDPAEGNAMIRIIKAAVLFELSVVTRPAYAETSLEERAGLIRPRPRMHASGRWR